MSRRAADLLVDCLAAHAVDRVFCVPGESYLSVLDALHDRNAVETIICRHEGGAAFMAVTDGKLTGRPGIAFVSRGPGATNASIGVHLAEQDAAPMILFIGHVPRGEIGRGSFQEVDYAKMFGDMAKGVFLVEDAGRIPEIVARAFVLARAPTPGPVVVVLPEDMLDDTTTMPIIAEMAVPRAGAATDADIAKIAEMLGRAERPLLIAGGGLQRADGRAALLAASEALQIPVALTFKRQELFPNEHPHYAGHLGFKIPKAAIERLNRADLILAVGTRLGEVPTQGYSFPRAPVPDQPLIHIIDDARHISRNIQAALGVVADPVATLRRLSEKKPPAPAARAAWIEILHTPTKRMRTWTPPADGLLDMGPIVNALVGKVPGNAILITDAGNFSGWLHAQFPFSGRHDAIGSIGGAMGLAMPAAVAAGLRAKDRVVITFIGDGGALMTGSELATAIQYGVPVKVFISNNGSYGTIRMHQEKAYRGRVVGTQLTNPDFAKWAESFGARGLTVTSVAEAAPAVATALAHPGPVVVDVRTAVERIAPNTLIKDLKPA